MRIYASRQDAGEEGACDTTKESLLARQKDQRRSETELDDTRFERPNGRVGLIICRSGNDSNACSGRRSRNIKERISQPKR